MSSRRRLRVKRGYVNITRAYIEEETSPRYMPIIMRARVSYVKHDSRFRERERGMRMKERLREQLCGGDAIWVYML